MENQRISYRTEAIVVGYKKKTNLKNCGILWVGEIPEHWDMKKFKHFYASSMGNTILKEDLSDEAATPVYSATEYVEILGYIDNPNVILNKDDFIIPARGNSIGHVKLVAEKCTCTQTTIYARSLNPGRINPNFVYWYQIGLRSKLYEFDNTAIPQLTVRQVKENPILVPSPDEQQAIAAFLDRETARIDALIQKKERMIELLKEKRIALITQAVTKGLDPNVPMKTSGIEWLGEVPEHWDIAKVGNGFSIQLGKMLQPDQDKDTDVLVPYLKAINVQWDVISVDEETQMWASPDEIGKYGVRRGDLLVCEGGEVGRASMLTDDIGIFIIQNALHRVRSKNNNTEYLKFLLQVAANQSWFDILCNKATIAHFTREKFSDLLIPYPPHEEQAAIVRYLTVILRDTQLLLDRIAESIILLREYRSSLIRHAVTGKIDLRGYDAQAQ